MGRETFIHIYFDSRKLVLSICLMAYKHLGYLMPKFDFFLNV